MKIEIEEQESQFRDYYSRQEHSTQSEHWGEQSHTHTRAGKREHVSSVITDNMKKVKPPKYDSSMSGDAIKAWLTEMEKYFEIYDYTENMKAVWEAYQQTREAVSGKTRR